MRGVEAIFEGLGSAGCAVADGEGVLGVVAFCALLPNVAAWLGCFAAAGVTFAGLACCGDCEAPADDFAFAAVGVVTAGAAGFFNEEAAGFFNGEAAGCFVGEVAGFFNGEAAAFFVGEAPGCMATGFFAAGLREPTPPGLVRLGVVTEGAAGFFKLGGVRPPDFVLACGTVSKAAGDLGLDSAVGGALGLFSGGGVMPSF